MFPQIERHPEWVNPKGGPVGDNLWSPVKEAQLHGFPHDMSVQQILAWRSELQSQLDTRKREVERYRHAEAASTLAASATKTESTPAEPKLISPMTEPATTPSAMRRATTNVVVPQWLKEADPAQRMFHLSPPSVLPTVVQAHIEQVSFPRSFEVQRVDQLAVLGDDLLILATDRRSSFSTDLRGDGASDLLAKRGRLWRLSRAEKSPVLFEPTLLTNSFTRFLMAPGRLWLAGEVTGFLDLKERRFRGFGELDGLSLGPTELLAIALGDVLAAGRMGISRFDQQRQRWTTIERPRTQFATAGGNYPWMCGAGDLICHMAGSAQVYSVTTGQWRQVPVEGARCVAAEAQGFWFGGRGGLALYSPATSTFSEWPATGSMDGIAPFLRRNTGRYSQRIGAHEVAGTSAAIQRDLARIVKQRTEVHPVSGQPKESHDPLGLTARVAGEVTAIALDGDHLWVALGDSPSYLHLLHKPTMAWVGCHKLDRRVTSLAVEPQHVWVGTISPEMLLVRVPKASFFSVPRSQWTHLAISPTDRAALLSNMTPRDQAMYAFYAGNDARVAELLGGSPLEKLQLDELFILAFSFDVLGLDRPDQARACFEHIIERSPDSPWAEFARECIVDNDRNHAKASAERSLLAKYDRDGDGVLSTAERSAMKRDPAYETQQQAISNLDLDAQITAILRQFDRSRDGKLDPEELERLSRTVAVFSDAKPEWLKGKTVLVAPLLSKQFPPTASILDQFDADKDGHINETELKALARQIRK
jgi:Ca2+-binding EF-hand superfamily protein